MRHFFKSMTVETRKPERGGNRVCCTRAPNGQTQDVTLYLVNKHSGCDAEIYEVGHRIEVSPYGCFGIQISGTRAVGNIEDGGQDKCPDCPAKLRLTRKGNRRQPARKRRKGQRIREIAENFAAHTP